MSRPQAELPADDQRIERFLNDALAAGLIDALTFDRLDAFVRARARVAGQPIPPMPGRAAATTAAPKPTVRDVSLSPDGSGWTKIDSTESRAPQRVEPSGGPAAHAPMPRIRRLPVRPPTPKLFEHWFEKVKEAVVSDVAVHGLAYLGVVLVFAGTLGFLLFSFGSMSTNARPWAELAVPTVLLGSAAFLRARGAPVVATSLGLIGGLLLPVVLFASYVDSVQFPPDMHGAALGWTVVGTSLALAAAYALVAVRWPEVSVRFLGAPMLWTALFGVGLLLSGDQRATLTSWTSGQFALVWVGIAVTSVVVRVRPSWAVSRSAAPTLIPGALVALSLVLLLAAGQGWPGWPLILTGLSMLATSEAMAERLGERATQLLQAPCLWLALAGSRLEFGDAATGSVAVATSLALLEWQALRRPGPAPVALAAAGVMGGLAMAAQVVETDPWAGVGVTLPLTIWAEVRRIRPLVGLGEEPGSLAMAAVAAVTPFFLAAAWIDAMPDGVAFLTLGLLLAAVAFVSRRYRRDDAFLRTWTIVGSASVGVTVASWGGLSPWMPAGTLALSTGAIALVPGSPKTRAWLGSAGLAATAVTTMSALHFADGVTALVVAMVACAAATVLTWSRSEVMAHVSAAAWCAATVAIVVLEVLPRSSLSVIVDPWMLPVAVGAWTIAALSVTGASTKGERGASRILRQALAFVALDSGVRFVPTMLVLIGLLSTLVSACDATGLTTDRPNVVWVLVAGLAFVEAVSTRALLGLRDIVRAIGFGAFGLAVVAVLGSVSFVSVAASSWMFGLAIGTVVALAPEARPAGAEWVAWVFSGALVAQVARFTGLSDRNVAAAVAAWTALAGIGALVADDRLAAARSSGQFVRTAWLLPPAVLGLVAFTPSLVLAMQESSDLRIALLALAGGAAFGAVALLLRLGAVSLGAWAFLSVSAGYLSPWSPQDHPWIGVAWAAILAATGLILGPGGPLRFEKAPSPRRWDLPPLAVALATEAVTLGWAAHVDVDVAITWTLGGFVVLAVAVVWRSLWLAGAGAVLVLIGAADAGHGWASAAFALTAAGVAVVASRRPDAMTRRSTQALAAILADVSLVELFEFTGWSKGQASGVALGLAAVCGAPILVPAVRRSVGVWFEQLAALTVALWLVGIEVAGSATPPLHGWIALALAFAAVAIAIGASRNVEREARIWMQAVAAGLAALSLFELSVYQRWSDGLTCGVALSLSAVAAVAGLGLAVRSRSPAWRNQLGSVSLAWWIVGAAAATSALPQREPMTVTLLMASAGSAAAGLSLRRFWPLAAASVFACAAWLVGIGDLIRGSAMWWAMPVGLAMLVIAETGRWWNRNRTALEGSAEPLRILEYAGMAALLAPPLVETATVSPFHAVFAILVGLALTMWGIVTKVRRRLFVGEGGVVLAIVIVLGGQIAELIPKVTGAWLWAVLVAIGIVLIVVATSLERGRAKIAAVIKRLDQLFADWE